MISIGCAGCGKRLKAKVEHAGRKARCPNCGQVMTLPAISQASTHVEVRTDLPPARPASAVTPLPAQPAAPAPAPPRRRPVGLLVAGAAGFLVLMTGAGIALAL